MKTLSRTSQDANPASPLARWRAESLRAITLAKSNSASTLRERTIEGLHEALLKKVKSLPHITPDTPILDIGCGSGAWMNRLAANGFAVLHGVDGDTEQFAGERGTCSAVSLDTDVDLGLGDRKFGLITSIELIEHLENPGTLFFHVARHLSDDGVFLMTTPNIHSLPCRLRFLLTGKLKDFDSKGDQTHIYPVLLTSLQRILPRHGLRIVDKWPYPANGRSTTWRPVFKLAASVLGWILPNDDPGDILCLMVRKDAVPDPARY